MGALDHLADDAIDGEQNGAAGTNTERWYRLFNAVEDFVGEDGGVEGEELEDGEAGIGGGEGAGHGGFGKGREEEQDEEVSSKSISIMGFRIYTP